MEDLAALQMKTAEDSLTLAVDSLRIKDWREDWPVDINCVVTLDARNPADCTFDLNFALYCNFAISFSFNFYFLNINKHS